MVGSEKKIIPILCKDALNKLVLVEDILAVTGMIINLFLGEFAALPLLKIDFKNDKFDLFIGRF